MLNRLLGRQKRDEVEPPTECGVDPRDRTISRVHRSDDEEVRRQAEWLVVVLKANRAIPVLEEEEKLAEDLRNVPPVDLIDDEQVGMSGIGGGSLGDPLERPVSQRVQNARIT